jgi:hypothetical protein
MVFATGEPKFGNLARSVLATDPDDLNGPNGDDKNGTAGNPHCQLEPASR